MPLTDTAIWNAKPADKPKRLFDERGLYLEVSPNGGKWWRLKYRFDGREKRVSLDVYPDVSLKDARERRDKLRKQIADKIDPAAVRRDERAARDRTFQAVAEEWIASREKVWSPRTYGLVTGRLTKDLFPKVGSRPINAVSAPELLRALEGVQARGALEAVHRLRQDANLIFRFALSKGYVERDPAADLKGALHARTTTHHAAITEPREIGALLRAIEGFQGEAVTRAALRLAPYVFVRPGELRAAEWAEIDLDAAEWRIPIIRMKMRKPHLVPLSRQAVAILRALQPLTGTAPRVGPHYVFPSVRTRTRPMSENTINAALRRLGYSTQEMTGHGFRAMATTRLSESRLWNRDAIERQLAHIEQSKSRKPYDHAQHIQERRRMMQWWSDYLDSLRHGGKVVPIRKTPA